MKPLRPGDMRHRVSYEAPTDGVVGPTNEPTEDFSEVFACWAEVTELSGREFMQGNQLNVVATHRVRLWHRLQVSERGRFRYQGRKLNVTHVNDVGGLRRELEVMCLEVKG